jgi:hypothetical protein
MSEAPWWGWALLIAGLWLVLSTLLPGKRKKDASTSEYLKVVGMLIDVSDKAILGSGSISVLVLVFLVGSWWGGRC